MHSADSTRRRQLAEIAAALPERVSELSTLFFSRTDPTVSRTDVAVMRRLSQRPRRITELAAEQQITQPGMSLLVNRIAERGWAERGADPSDGRAVLVSLTEAGTEELRRLEEGYHAMVTSHMAGLNETQLTALLEAVRVLEDLIDGLRRAQAS